MRDGQHKTICELISEHQKQHGQFDMKLFQMHCEDPLTHFHFNDEECAMDFIHFSAEDAEASHLRISQDPRIKTELHPAMVAFCEGEEKALEKVLRKRTKHARDLDETLSKLHPGDPNAGQVDVTQDPNE